MSRINYDIYKIDSLNKTRLLSASCTHLCAKVFTCAGNTGGIDYDERQRKLEQLAQLQQRYDTLAIDDLVARKQKELEIERDAELAKAQSLGASETLLRSIRDHYADESVRVATDGKWKSVHLG